LHHHRILARHRSLTDWSPPWAASRKPGRGAESVPDGFHRGGLAPAGL